MLEFVLVCPLLLFIILATIEFSRCLIVKGLLTTAANRALSQASVVKDLDTDCATLPAGTTAATCGQNRVTAITKVLNAAKILPFGSLIGPTPGSGTANFHPGSGANDPAIELRLKNKDPNEVTAYYLAGNSSTPQFTFDPVSPPGTALQSYLQQNPLEVVLRADVPSFFRPLVPGLADHWTIEVHAVGFRELPNVAAYPARVDCRGVLIPAGGTGSATCPCANDPSDPTVIQSGSNCVCVASGMTQQTDGSGNVVGCTCPTNQVFNPNALRCEGCPWPLTAVNGACTCTRTCTGGTVNASCTGCDCPNGTTSSNNVCCPPGQVGQAGACVCPTAIPGCIGGSVTQNGASCDCTCPNGQTLSNGRCCPNGTVESNGICCAPGTVGSGGTCCPTASPYNVGGLCCPNANDTNAGGICCPYGSVNVGGTCGCPASSECINGNCCSGGTWNYTGGGCVCDCGPGKHNSGGLCCPTNEYNTGGICCRSGQVNVGGVCQCPTSGCQGGTINPGTCACSCPNGQTLSGGLCCPTGQYNSAGICCSTGTQNSGGICCPYNQSNVGGVCTCPSTGCTGGSINPTTCACSCPNGQTLSGGLCCPNGQSNSGGMCCPTNQYNSAGKCCPNGTYNSSDLCCPNGQSNVGGVCSCPGELVDVNGTCRCPGTLIQNGNNCGCPNNQIEIGTSCGCPNGQVLDDAGFCGNPEG
ncbi:MAG: TadE/TadG family type IV pilus assembly protein [Bdellovibrionota bacterium]